MKKLPKEHRQQIYGYIEELLARPLTLDEHDVLRDMMTEYAISTQDLRSMLRRYVCLHDWASDRVGLVEGGTNSRMYVKCRKCDKRTSKKMPTISMNI
jgi:hypothetical protein